MSCKEDQRLEFRGDMGLSYALIHILPNTWAVWRDGVRLGNVQQHSKAGLRFQANIDLSIADCPTPGDMLQIAEFMRHKWRTAVLTYSLPSDN